MYSQRLKKYDKSNTLLTMIILDVFRKEHYSLLI